MQQIPYTESCFVPACELLSFIENINEHKRMSSPKQVRPASFSPSLATPLSTSYYADDEQSLKSLVVSTYSPELPSLNYRKPIHDSPSVGRVQYRANESGCYQEFECGHRQLLKDPGCVTAIRRIAFSDAKCPRCKPRPPQERKFYKKDPGYLCRTEYACNHTTHESENKAEFAKGFSPDAEDVRTVIFLEKGPCDPCWRIQNAPYRFEQWWTRTRLLRSVMALFFFSTSFICVLREFEGPHPPLGMTLFLLNFYTGELLTGWFRRFWNRYVKHVCHCFLIRVVLGR